MNEVKWFAFPVLKALSRKAIYRTGVRKIFAFEMLFSPQAIVAAQQLDIRVKIGQAKKFKGAGIQNNLSQLAKIVILLNDLFVVVVKPIAQVKKKLLSSAGAGLQNLTLGCLFQIYSAEVKLTKRTQQHPSIMTNPNEDSFQITLPSHSCSKLSPVIDLIHRKQSFARN